MKFAHLTITTVAAALAQAASAGELVVTPAARCGAVIMLYAKEVPLSTVLRKLAANEGFALLLDPGRDPLVDRELRLPLDKLLKTLTRSQNLVLEDKPDPDCPGLRRVVKVALLPEGRELAPRPPPPPPQQTEEQKESLARYRRAHGLDDTGQPIKRQPPVPPP